MRKISVFLILALLVSLLASCNSRSGESSGAKEMENDGLQPPIDSIIGDIEEDTVPGLSEEPELGHESSDEHKDTSVESASDSTLNTDGTENCESSSSSESDSEVEAESPDENLPIETEGELESATPEDSETAEPPADTESETEAYDGMEVTLPDSSRLISQAYSAGLTAGYSVARGSARIIQPNKDNPNLIQVVFETDNENVRVAVNYYRKSENATWKLVNGLPISILESEEDN